MARLAEYLKELAAVFGDTEGVHFSRLEKGSTRVVAKLEARASQRVQNRVYNVRDRRAPGEAMRAAGRINDMLAADKTTARVMFGASVALRFSGGSPARNQPISVVETGTITGRLYALFEEKNNKINGRIRPKGGSDYVICLADGRAGEKLASLFQKTIRVTGRGKWMRGEDGGWSCRTLEVQDAVAVKDVSLRTAIDALRGVEAAWPDDPLEDWARLEEEGGAA